MYLLALMEWVPLPGVRTVPHRLHLMLMLMFIKQVSRYKEAFRETEEPTLLIRLTNLRIVRQLTKEMPILCFLRLWLEAHRLRVTCTSSRGRTECGRMLGPLKPNRKVYSQE